MEENSNVPEPSNSSWLERLKEESWEAELIISGLAIFGSSRLPGIILNLIDWSAYHTSGSSHFFQSLFWLYLFSATYALIFCFIAHFVLRTLWVGVVGLGYTFPGGIKRIKGYSEDFMDKLLKEFPSLDGFAFRLDKICSAIFGLAACVGLMFMMLSVFILLIYLLSLLIAAPFDTVSTNQAFAVIFLIFAVLSFFQAALNLKFLRERSWVKRIHFPFYKAFNRVFLNILYYPFNYIYWTFFTNINRIYFIIFITVGSMFIALASGPSLFSRYSFEMISDEDEEYTQDARKGVLGKEFYRDTKKENYSYVPYIPSKVLSEEGYLPVFIPILRKERTAIDSICGKFNDLDEEDIEKKLEYLNNRDSFYLNYCYHKYVKLKINDRKLSPQDFIWYLGINDNGNSYGINAYLPIKLLKSGKNNLEITKHYRTRKGRLLRYPIPFLYVKKDTPAPPSEIE